MHAFSCMIFAIKISAIWPFDGPANASRSIKADQHEKPRNNIMKIDGNNEIVRNAVVSKTDSKDATSDNEFKDILKASVERTAEQPANLLISTTSTSSNYSTSRFFEPSL